MSHHAGVGTRSSISSTFKPFQQPLFRALWIAAVVSNIGTWMQEVGEAWLMTSLTASPTLVGLLETAITLPMFLFSLPAGALADIIDRRRMLMFTQTWMTIAAVMMALLTFTGVMTPWMLLLTTFILSVGAAMNGPAWQASIPELVERADLPSAITLGSVGFNVARAVGPALAGIVVAAWGAWASFLLNGVSFLGVIVVLYRWKREHHESLLPAERMASAIRAGLRYVRHAPVMRAVLVRTGAFIFFGSALWATLPFIARHGMGLTSVQYGILLGAFGAGAVIGAWVITKLRQTMSTDAMVRSATVIFVFLLLTLGFVRVFLAVLSAMFVGGTAWMVLMSSLNTTAQLSSPSWVRARTMAIYLLVFMGGFAAGAPLWGLLASMWGIPTALSIAAIGLIVGIPATLRFRLIADESVDLTPSMHWPEPTVAIEPHPEHGPVMVTVEYRIRPNDVIDFSAVMRLLGRIRRRDGAVQWGIFTDMADPARHVESFIVGSWAEHLRQHERVTQADRAIEDRAHAFHQGPDRPKVSHFIYIAEETHGIPPVEQSGEIPASKE